jgi:phosphatidylserine/phosphatidylglycerophosphate/cardiolipin synthase-like enzyme
MTRLILILLLAAAPLAHAGERAQVYFSPHGGCTAAIVREIAAAKHTVHVQAYSMTSAPIAKALVDAEHRHVDVEVILDRSNRTDHYSAATYLAHGGVPVAIDARHAIAHNKIVIVDGTVVATGSFNLTKQAENANAENLLVLHDAELAAKYEANWRAHREHSEVYP